MRAARRLGAFAAAAALLAVLTGCISIPTGGGVTTVGIAAAQGADDTIPAPNGPEKGASPDEIVAGFVRAGGGPQGGYAVAKEFLADSLRSKWKPGSGTLVSDSAVLPVATSPNQTSSYTVALDVEGQIDATGVYTPQTSGEHDLDFHLVKQNGQWRIDQAPDGVVIRSRDLGTVVQPYDLYFFDPGYDYLVPDLRWFADQGGSGFVAGRVVNALLAGPAPWLAAPVVASAFPGGAQLGDAPALNAGTMTVDLSADVLDAGATQQGRMLQQLTWSLRPLGAQSVTMTANGLSVPVNEPSSADGALAVPYEAIGSDGKLFGPVTPNGVTALASLGTAIQGLAPTGVALGRGRADAAVRGTGGVSLVSPSAKTVVDGRSGLLVPSIDPAGYVWSAQADPSTLVAVKSDGKQHPVPVTASGQLVSIAVSRDGTRLLVALQTDAGAQVLVLGIERDKDGAPTGFGPPLAVPVDANQPVIAAAWIDGGSVAVLQGQSGGQDTVAEYALGGLTVAHGSVRAGTALAAGSGGSGFDAIRVLLASGDLQQPSVVEGWQSTGAHLALLGTQQ